MPYLEPIGMTMTSLLTMVRTVHRLSSMISQIDSVLSLATAVQRHRLRSIVCHIDSVLSLALGELVTQLSHHIGMTSHQLRDSDLLWAFMVLGLASLWGMGLLPTQLLQLDRVLP